MMDLKKYIEQDYMLEKTDFPLPNRYQGKVRDNYDLDDGTRVIITTDRLSAFDRVITLIPLKGQLLNGLNVFWLNKTGKTVPNHLVSVPDPNVMIVKKCEPLPVEMVIRGYITGSAWRAYEKNPNAPVSGILFPRGLEKNEQLAAPVITPSTKARSGHDEPISKSEIIQQGIVQEDIYKKMEAMTVRLFVIGTQIADKNGLILVDTKYEFGMDADGNLMIIDEIHTPDSSRFWYKAGYEERFDEGREQRGLDKEFMREWLRDKKGFTGNGDVPEVNVDVKIELALRYITNYNLITGNKFEPHPIGEPIIDRVKNALINAGVLKNS